jgi:predicted small secreted protein
MHMKHRWIGGLLLAAALTLAACAPPDQGAGDESAEPDAPSSEATDAAPAQSGDPSPMETEGGVDEY